MILDAEYWAYGCWRWMNAQSRTAKHDTLLNDLNEQNQLNDPDDLNLMDS
jgi:hypothetical protein